MDHISLRRPDDWHLHLRDGAVLAATVPDAARRFARAIVMPNLKPAVRTTAQALDYRERILGEVPDGSSFDPLMTLYQDFDWADEVNHVHFGRKWLIQFHFAGNRSKAQAVADETKAERVAYYEQYARENNQAPDDQSHSGY